jgi:hypothetical protein
MKEKEEEDDEEKEEGQNEDGYDAMVFLVLVSSKCC